MPERLQGKNPWSFEAPEQRPNQVTGVLQLEAGSRYVIYTKGRVARWITVLSVPYEGEVMGANVLWVDVKEDFRDLASYRSGHAPADHKHKISLADNGVVPDSEGRWNVWNYIVPFDKAK